MPLQNRVTPEGEIVADAARGTMMGNRGGAFHDADRRLGRRRWVSRQWICCRLAFKGRRREVMAPGRYTELFFLDEATAYAAGHRPCFECRREDALRFAELFARVRGLPSRATAPAMDRVLHAERVDGRGRKAAFQAPLGDLPDGTFIRGQDRPQLVLAGRLYPWSHQGYGAPEIGIAGQMVDVLTPRTVVAVLSAGLRPLFHPTARS